MGRERERNHIIFTTEKRQIKSQIIPLIDFLKNLFLKICLAEIAVT